MGITAAPSAILFMTLPSIIYSIILGILVLLISLPIRPFTGGMRSAVIGDAIAVKLTPVILIIVLPTIFYFFVWQPLAWIFFGWMVLYFILRRYTGVSEKHAQLDRQFKEAGQKWRELENGMRNAEKTDSDTE